MDWECVHYVPLWKACQLPDFLRDGDRTEEPIYDAYAHNDDGTTGEGYLRHRREYELTLLRATFLDRMSQIEPSWTDIYYASSEKVDFCFAVENCDSELCLRRIKKWLDNQAAGEEYYSLVHEIMQ